MSLTSNFKGGHLIIFAFQKKIEGRTQNCVFQTTKNKIRKCC